MKLSISNIAWSKDKDEEMYKYLSKIKFSGIEIAPTRIFEENPYSRIEEAKHWKQELENKYNLEISSMQSIWFGKQGNIFNEEEAKEFIDYTKKAIDFASTIKCNNLVFGCPKNRIIPEGKSEDDVIGFFKTLGDYAKERKTVVALEPNPTIYGTNFINYTNQALEFVKKVNSDGLKVNVDFGTIIENKEELDTVFSNIDFVNHIHISEPNLEPVKEREEHKVLADNLRKLDYDKYVSIEMKNTGDMEKVRKVIEYVKEIFA